MNEIESLLERGLTSQEAEARLASQGPNELPGSRPKNFLQQIWAVVRQPMLLLLLVAGGLNLALAEPLDGIILMFFVLVVTGISIYQERKSEEALSALRELSAPQALVKRDGQLMRIASRQIVVGDIVVLNEGDRVPADGLLLAGGVSIDESSLTGESIHVRKTPSANIETQMVAPGNEATAATGAASTPWLYSGTLAVSGRGSMLVLATGANSQLGRIGSALQTIESTDTPLQREINSLVRVIAVIGVAAALAVTVVYALTRHNWLQGLLAGIATAMAMLPEEFPVVFTVFVALGAWRLSKVHVLARRSAVIETLGSATVICVDKTGTITQNRMDVGNLLPTAGVTEDQLATLAHLASPPDSFDPMDKAFRALGEQRAPQTLGYRLVAEYPLTNSLLAVTQVWQDAAEPNYIVATKGAPEAIAELSGATGYEPQVQENAASGGRVLGVARASWPAISPLPTEVSSFNFEFAGLAVLHDPIRGGVPEAIGEATAAGIRTVMITGDYPGTALAIANEIGLDTTHGCITGAELAQLTEAQLAARIAHVNVFARMVPEQKLQLVRALRANGEVVAMTGDGVNDSPALKAAHIGIAMGLRGTDVARESAGLVLVDDNFTSIVAGIRQGRTIFENMRKALSYVIAVHLPILGMTLIPVMAGNLPLVLVPVLIAVLELIIDPACSVVFESEEAAADTMTRKPRAIGAKLFQPAVLASALGQGLAALAAVLAVYAYGIATHHADLIVRTMAFVTLVVTNLLLILINRSTRLTAIGALMTKKNPTVKWVLAGAIAFLLAVTNLPFLRTAFNLGAISPTDWALALGAGIVALVGFDLQKVIRRNSSK